jgi:hypothetical protein
MKIGGISLTRVLLPICLMGHCRFGLVGHELMMQRLDGHGDIDTSLRTKVA